MNKLKVVFSQNFDKPVKRGGVETVKHVQNTVEFTEKTPLAVDSVRFSDWLLGRLLNYQLIRESMGSKEKFDTSAPVDITITVNDEVRSAQVKFSTNAKTLTARMEKYPTVISAVFNPTNYAYGTSREQFLALAKGTMTQIAAASPEEAGPNPLVEDILIPEEVA